MKSRRAVLATSLLFAVMACKEAAPAGTPQEAACRAALEKAAPTLRAGSETLAAAIGKTTDATLVHQSISTLDAARSAEHAVRAAALQAALLEARLFKPANDETRAALRKETAAVIAEAIATVKRGSDVLSKGAPAAQKLSELLSRTATDLGSACAG